MNVEMKAEVSNGRARPLASCELGLTLREAFASYIYTSDLVVLKCEMDLKSDIIST